MAELRKNGPFIWVTWWTRLLVGENSCEWAVWFRAQHEGWSWTKAPSGFDLVGWQLAHTRGSMSAGLSGKNAGIRCTPRARTVSPCGAGRPPLGGSPT